MLSFLLTILLPLTAGVFLLNWLVAHLLERRRKHRASLILFFVSPGQHYTTNLITKTLLHLRSIASFSFTADIYHADGTAGHMKKLIQNAVESRADAIVVFETPLLTTLALCAHEMGLTIPLISCSTSFGSRLPVKASTFFSLPAHIITISYNWEDKIQHIYETLPHVRNIVLLYPTSHRVLQSSLHEQHILTQLCARGGIKTYIVYVYDYLHITIPPPIAHYADLIILPTTAPESFVYRDQITAYAASLRISVLIPTLSPPRTTSTGTVREEGGSTIEERTCTLVAQSLHDTLREPEKSTHYTQKNSILTEGEELAMDITQLAPLELEQVVLYVMREKGEVIINLKEPTPAPLIGKDQFVFMEKL